MFQPSCHSEVFRSTAMATTNDCKALDNVCPHVNTSGDEPVFKINAWKYTFKLMGYDNKRRQRRWSLVTNLKNKPQTPWNAGEEKQKTTKNPCFGGRNMRLMGFKKMIMEEWLHVWASVKCKHCNPCNAHNYASNLCHSTCFPYLYFLHPTYTYERSSNEIIIF